MKRCPYWTPTAAGPKGCSLPARHDGEHRLTVTLRLGPPIQFSGFGIGKMNTNPKQSRKL